MYINFQQNQVSRSVTTVHTHLFVNSRKLHKFAATNGNFEKIEYFRYTSADTVHVYQFSAKSS